MQISTRGLLLVLVLGALFILAFGLVVLKDSLHETHQAFKVAFRTPSGTVIEGGADKPLPSLRALFPQPKANGMIPPPPPTAEPQLSGWSSIRLND